MNEPITRRDYFAGLAMKALLQKDQLARTDLWGQQPAFKEQCIARMANLSGQIADSMITALDETRKEEPEA